MPDPSAPTPAPPRGRSAGARDSGEQRQRKLFARRQWRRRWLTWKYVLAGVLVLALVAGGTWAVFFSDKLAVHEVRVSGTSLLKPDRVRTLADVESGRPLALVDLDRARRRVASLAAVKSVDVTREWPDAVRVTVVEREAVAVVQLGTRLQGMDGEGVIFRGYRRQPADLPLVQASTGTGTAALAEGATVIASLPAALAAQVEHLQVATVDGITLVLRDGRKVVWGSADESALKAEVLAALLSEPGSTYDVSAPQLPTVKP